jgi:hypothetical protein
MKTLKQQLQPTNAERALNISTLTREKLEVLEARVSSNEKLFREEVKAARADLRAGMEADINRLMQEQIESRVHWEQHKLMCKFSNLSFWAKLKVLFGRGTLLALWR